MAREMSASHGSADEEVAARFQFTCQQQIDVIVCGHLQTPQYLQKNCEFVFDVR